MCSRDEYERSQTFVKEAKEEAKGSKNEVKEVEEVEVKVELIVEKE